MQYIVDIADKTRKNEQLSLGVSPRGSLALMHACMAYALLKGRTFVLPDDVKLLAVPVLAHRLVLQMQASFQNKSAEAVLRDILRTVPVPVVS
jgi:MoxR-like ATPase